MKKFYISADIEGTNGICDWDETNKNTQDYPTFAERMTAEISAVCNGINTIYPNCDILVKDAHDSGRNVIHQRLPENVLLNKGWSKDPLMMMSCIDRSYEASIFTGYHSGSGTVGNPLAHTMSVSEIVYMKINNQWATEFLYNYYISNYYNVPVIMVTGDEELCKHVKKINPNIITVATLSGYGGSVTSKHPNLTLKEIRESAMLAINNIDECKIEMPKYFEIEICFKEGVKAFRASYYPGVKLKNDTTILFSSEDYFDIIKMFLFI